jgi:hypothetical protein
MSYPYRPKRPAFRRPCHGFQQLNKDGILLSEFQPGFLAGIAAKILAKIPIKIPAKLAARIFAGFFSPTDPARMAAFRLWQC